MDMYDKKTVEALNKRKKKYLYILICIIVLTCAVIIPTAFFINSYNYVAFIVIYSILISFLLCFLIYYLTGIVFPSNDKIRHIEKVITSDSKIIESRLIAKEDNKTVTRNLSAQILVFENGDIKHAYYLIDLDANLIIDATYKLTVSNNFIINYEKQ